MIERASSADLMELASEYAGSPMQVGAVLVLDGAAATESAVRAAIAERIRAVPRLRQRLIDTPRGCGRPVWVDDPAFDVERHVGSVACRAPGDEQALLGVASGLVHGRLPRDRPLWSATVLTGLAGGNTAIVLVIHHVLADGMGGLAVLARLVDGAPTPAPSTFPMPPPTRGLLFRDAVQTRLVAALHAAAGLRALRTAVGELASGSKASAARCSLNRPTGPRRALATARADLAAVRAIGRASDATVNDVVLTAVTGALRDILSQRGEAVDTIVVSVPVSSRREASATQLGNQSAVMPVAVPTGGAPQHRLSTIAQITRARKASVTPGASDALLCPAFRILAKAGAFQWFVNRQHLVNTLVTNLRGPDRRMTFLGAQITAVVPVTQTTGNVTVAFSVLSYAGDLVVTMVADPDQCPDLPLLAKALQSELDVLTGRGPVPRAALPTTSA